MLKRLPCLFYKISQYENINFFFGFVYVELLEKPMCSIIYQKRYGILFSEEVKALIKVGYKFRYICFYTFIGAKLFTNYVSHFFTLRMYTKAIFLKYLTKQCLNTLYGKFSTKTSKRNALQISMAINSYGKAEMIPYMQIYFVYADTDSIIYENSLN